MPLTDLFHAVHYKYHAMACAHGQANALVRYWPLGAGLPPFSDRNTSLSFFPFSGSFHLTCFGCPAVSGSEQECL